MDFSDVAGLVKKFAPLLGTVIGGPIGGAAGGVLAGVASLFDSDPDDPDGLIEAIKADPKAAIKLKEFEITQRVELERLAIRRDEMYIQDVESARTRQVEVTKATGKVDYNLYVLAWVIIAGFFGLCGLLTFRPLPVDSSQIVFMLFGGLLSAFTGVVAYFFGSSKGSADKTKLLTSSALK